METLKRYRLWAIVVSCCMIVLGAAMILRPDISALAVCYLTGVEARFESAAAARRYAQRCLQGKAQER